MLGISKKTHHYQIEEKGQDKFYTGIFIGVIIGAGLYWLFKSTAGKKVRQSIMSSEADWAKQVKELIAETNVSQFFDGDDNDQEESIAPVTPAARSSFINSITTTPASLKRRFFKVKH